MPANMMLDDARMLDDVIFHPELLRSANAGKPDLSFIQGYGTEYLADFMTGTWLAGQAAVRSEVIRTQVLFTPPKTLNPYYDSIMSRSLILEASEDPNAVAEAARLRESLGVPPFQDRAA
jgi:hypothetical protein